MAGTLAEDEAALEAEQDEELRIAQEMMQYASES
jgi:hypothetical protein